MDFGMFGTGDNLKVLNSVVSTITVEMMDMLRGKQFSSEMAFHYKAVFSYALIPVSDITIPSMSNPALGLLDPIAALGVPVGIAMTPESCVVHSAHA